MPTATASDAGARAGDDYAWALVPRELLLLLQVTPPGSAAARAINAGGPLLLTSPALAGEPLPERRHNYGFSRR
jgi:hypothetical protein